MYVEKLARLYPSAWHLVLADQLARSELIFEAAGGEGTAWNYSVLSNYHGSFGELGQATIFK